MLLGYFFFFDSDTVKRVSYFNRFYCCCHHHCESLLSTHLVMRSTDKDNLTSSCLLESHGFFLPYHTD